MSQFPQVARQVTAAPGDAFVAPAVRRDAAAGREAADIAQALLGFDSSLTGLAQVVRNQERVEFQEEAARLVAANGIDSAARITELREQGVIPANADPILMHHIEKLAANRKGRETHLRVTEQLQRDPSYQSLNSIAEMASRYDEAMAQALGEDTLNEQAMVTVAQYRDGFLADSSTARSKVMAQEAVQSSVDDAFNSLEALVAEQQVDLNAGELHEITAFFQDPTVVGTLFQSVSGLSQSEQQEAARNVAQLIAMKYENAEVGRAMLAAIPYGEGTMADSWSGADAWGDSLAEQIERYRDQQDARRRNREAAEIDEVTRQFDEQFYNHTFRGGEAPNIEEFAPKFQGMLASRMQNLLIDQRAAAERLRAFDEAELSRRVEGFIRTTGSSPDIETPGFTAEDAEMLASVAARVQTSVATQEQTFQSAEANAAYNDIAEFFAREGRIPSNAELPQYDAGTWGVARERYQDLLMQREMADLSYSQAIEAQEAREKIEAAENTLARMFNDGREITLPMLQEIGIALKLDGGTFMDFITSGNAFGESIRESRRETPEMQEREAQLRVALIDGTLTNEQIIEYRRDGGSLNVVQDLLTGRAEMDRGNLTTSVRIQAQDFRNRLERYASENLPPDIQARIEEMQFTDPQSASRIEAEYVGNLVDEIGAEFDLMLSGALANGELSDLPADQVRSTIRGIAANAMAAMNLDANIDDIYSTVSPEPMTEEEAEADTEARPVTQEERLSLPPVEQFLIQDPIFAGFTMPIQQAEVWRRTRQESEESMRKIFELRPEQMIESDSVVSQNLTRAFARDNQIATRALNALLPRPGYPNTDYRIVAGATDAVDSGGRINRRAIEFGRDVPQWARREAHTILRHYELSTLNRRQLDAALSSYLNSDGTSASTRSGHLSTIRQRAANFEARLGDAHQYIQRIGAQARENQDMQLFKLYSGLRQSYGYTVEEFMDMAEVDTPATMVRLFPSPSFAYAKGIEYAERIGIPIPEDASEYDDDNHPFNRFMQTQVTNILGERYDKDRVIR